ncbi:MAG: glucose-6-phosphate dehydrogenase [Bacillota bacterium]
MKKNELSEAVQFVIFGGAGDLSQTKLLPGLYRLFKQELLAEEFKVLCLDQAHSERDEFLDSLAETLAERESEAFKSIVWKRFEEKLDYMQVDFEQDSAYEKLAKRLEEREIEQSGKRIYYLATPPALFSFIAEKLKKYDLNSSRFSGWPRLVIEKPFGYDLETAQEFNESIIAAFPEENIYRIDHYLGREVVQNILTIRFSNILFDPLWNKNYIDNIQIISTHEEGVEQRGEYYNKSGALRDIVQGPLLQLLSLLTMEQPEGNKPADIRAKKIKLLDTLAEAPVSEVVDSLVLGQYTEAQVYNKYTRGYQQEEKVPSDSTAETFAALKLNINNQRWQGVPIYIKTGKRLQENNSKIYIQFKSKDTSDLEGDNGVKPNMLIISFYPREGVFLRFNAWEPEGEAKIIPVIMEYCQEAARDIQDSLEAYEELLVALLEGDQMLFTHWEIVRCSRMFIDKLKEAARKQDLLPDGYPAGSSGPEAAQKLLGQDDRVWLDQRE